MHHLEKFVVIDFAVFLCKELPEPEGGRMFVGVFDEVSVLSPPAPGFAGFALLFGLFKGEGIPVDLVFGIPVELGRGDGGGFEVAPAAKANVGVEGIIKPVPVAKVVDPAAFAIGIVVRIQRKGHGDSGQGVGSLELGEGCPI